MVSAVGPLLTYWCWFCVDDGILSCDWLMIGPNDRSKRSVQVLDLSHDVRAIKSLTGDNGENFNRIVMEVEMLGQDCELCSRVEAELQNLRNRSQDLSAMQEALQNLENRVGSIQTRLDSEGGGCSRVCSPLQDEVHSLRDEVRRCSERCSPGPDSFTGQAHLHQALHH